MSTSRVTVSNITASNITASNITELHGNATLFGPTARGSTDTESAGELTIDCDCCALRNTDACDDCVVSFLLDREPEDAVVIDADEARAMRMLERAGLVPTLRFSTQAG
jgi:hypothetical protein